MESAYKIKETNKDMQRRKLALQKRYVQRITIARQGREAFLKKDYLNASKKYIEYLSILSESKEVEDIYQLSPTMFDNKKEVTEMLLISHIFWEIARINEMTPKLQKTYQMALNQFIKFTVNQPFQVLNAEMLRKYIKKSRNTSRQITLLDAAYQEIFVQSKKCFIATMCFGNEHPNTMLLRRFKQVLLKYNSGQKFVEVYYRYSSKLVDQCEKHPKLKTLSIVITKWPLSVFANVLNKSIMK